MISEVLLGSLCGCVLLRVCVCIPIYEIDFESKLQNILQKRNLKIGWWFVRARFLSAGVGSYK